MREKFCLTVFLFLFSSLLKIQNLSASGPFAYITNSDDGTISVIDTSNNTVNPVPIRVCCNPYGVAVALVKQKVYVTNPSSDKISVIDTSTTPNTVINTITVGGGPVGIDITSDEKRLYVTSAGVIPSGNVSVIDTATNMIIANITIGKSGSAPTGIIVIPNGKKVYVANKGSGSLSVIDTVTNKITTTISVGFWPEGLAVTPNGKKLYVTNNVSRNISVIDTLLDTVIATVPVGIGPIGITATPDGKKIYAVNYISRNVSVIDTVTDTVIATIPVGIDPIGIAITPDGRKAYVVNNDANNVSVIDTVADVADATLGGPIRVGRSPIAFGKFIAP